MKKLNAWELSKATEDERAWALDASRLLTSRPLSARMTDCDLPDGPEEPEKMKSSATLSDTLEPFDIYEWYERGWD